MTLTDEEIREIITEAEAYSRSDKFPTSSPYDGDPYRAKKLMQKLLLIIKYLMKERAE